LRKAIIGTCAASGFWACAKRSYDEQSAYVEAVEAVSMRPASEVGGQRDVANVGGHG
jgi:hypothetical protein